MDALTHRVVVSFQQLDHGALAATAWADQSHRLARRHIQAEPVQRQVLLTVRIGKIDGIGIDAALDGGDQPGLGEGIDAGSDTGHGEHQTGNEWGMMARGWHVPWVDG